MKTMSKVAVALVGMAGLAMAAETVQAAVEVNGAGSSAGRQFAALSPATVCQSSPTPLFFKDPGSPANMTEWQCKVGGVDHIFRYSASASADGYLKQPNGATATATYLVTSGCPAGSSTTINGVTVLQSVCPAGTPTTTKVVHWGGSDVQASSIHQTAFGSSLAPPAAGHLTPTPTVIVPFSIVVGANVRGQTAGGAATPLLSLTQEEIRQILAGIVTDWTQLGHTVSAGSSAIVTCQRTVGSGTLAALDETMMRTKFWSGGINGVASATNIANASSSNVKTCIESNLNGIAYIDSDTVPTLVSGAYQVAISGMVVNDPAAGSGVARLKDLRCGKYPYWADWNFITRNAGVEVAPVNAIAGTNAAITALGASMLATNPLPNYWLSENDTFVFKNDDRGPFNWFTPSNNGANISDVCRYAGSSK